MNRSSNALANLRAVVILIVLAFHSALPYLASLPATAYPFDSPPYRWLAFPIIDGQRWFGFDLFCAWQDLGLMTLMFFLSGLFVSPSVARKGIGKFLSDRLLRIALPFALAVGFLAPLAYYATYRTTAVDMGFEAYLRHWFALPFWPCGPQWFLSELLAFNLLAIAAYRLSPGWDRRLLPVTGWVGSDPVRFLVILVTLSALVYVPLVLIYSPFAWQNVGPFGFQLGRPLHYLVYFVAGIAVGAQGLDRGLLDCDGDLARRWPTWLAAAFAGFLLWAAPTSLTMADWSNASLIAKLAAGIGFVVASAAGCLCALAVCLRFAHWRRREFCSLSTNAYRMYLIHYPLAVWLQYALLDAGVVAVGKAAIVFCCTLVASWVIAAGLAGVATLSQFDATTRGATTGSQ